MIGPSSQVASILPGGGKARRKEIVTFYTIWFAKCEYVADSLAMTERKRRIHEMRNFNSALKDKSGFNNMKRREEELRDGGRKR